MLMGGYTIENERASNRVKEMLPFIEEMMVIKHLDLSLTQIIEVTILCRT